MCDPEHPSRLARSQRRGKPRRSPGHRRRRGGSRVALRVWVRFITACVGILAGSLAATVGARAQDLPRGRVPFSLQGGSDTPLGTGGLTIGAETMGGWGMGAGIGFKDAMPGTLHTLVA